MKKSLSIVIPALNEQSHLPVCLDAIAAQTMKPDEVIVVDNNSTDKTSDVIARYPFAKRVAEKRQGITFARSTGFDAVRSDIIARIDADTLLPPNWVEQVVAFYGEADHEMRALTGGCYFYNLHSGRLTGRMYDLIVFRCNKVLLGAYFPWGSNSALPRDAWHKVRDAVCQRTDIHEDLDLGYHLNRAGYHIEYKPSLRVGAVARRIITERGKLWQYLMMWPRTFRANGDYKGLLVWPLVVSVWLGGYVILVTEQLVNVFIRLANMWRRLSDALRKI